MKKNSQLHLWLETETLEKIRIEAEERDVSVAELCRGRLRQGDKLDKILRLLETNSKSYLS
jgi:hypothetical protein